MDCWGAVGTVLTSLKLDILDVVALSRDHGLPLMSAGNFLRGQFLGFLAFFPGEKYKKHLKRQLKL